MGIIKEIEHRFTENQIEAKDFSGIIIIDEIELHLHPAWQSQIAQILRNIFPCAQFIVTTHSPHVIQTANPEEVIALEFEKNGDMRRKDIPSEAGYRGWTIEEILTDVMGMPDVRTNHFNQLYNNFSAALDEETIPLAQHYANELLAILHPENAEAKLIRLQLASIGTSIE